MCVGDGLQPVARPA